MDKDTLKLNERLSKIERFVDILEKKVKANEDDDESPSTEKMGRGYQKVKKMKDVPEDSKAKKGKVEEAKKSLDFEIRNLLEKNKKSKKGAEDKSPLENGKVSGEKSFKPPYKGIKGDKHYKPINTEIKKKSIKVTK